MRLLCLQRLLDRRHLAKPALPRALLIDTCFVPTSISIEFGRKHRPMPMTRESPAVQSYGAARVVQPSSPHSKLFEVQGLVLADSVPNPAAPLVAAPQWARRASRATNPLTHRDARLMDSDNFARFSGFSAVVAKTLRNSALASKSESRVSMSAWLSCSENSVFRSLGVGSGTGVAFAIGVGEGAVGGGRMLEQETKTPRKCEAFSVFHQLTVRTVQQPTVSVTDAPDLLPSAAHRLVRNHSSR